MKEFPIHNSARNSLNLETVLLLHWHLSVFHCSLEINLGCNSQPEQHELLHCCMYRYLHPRSRFPVTCLDVTQHFTAQFFTLHTKSDYRRSDTGAWLTQLTLHLPACARLFSQEWYGNHSGVGDNTTNLGQFFPIHVVRLLWMDNWQGSAKKRKLLREILLDVCIKAERQNTQTTEKTEFVEST